MEVNIISGITVVLLTALVGFGITIGALVAISLGMAISEFISAIIRWFKTPVKRRKTKSEKVCTTESCPIIHGTRWKTCPKHRKKSRVWARKHRGYKTHRVKP